MPITAYEIEAMLRETFPHATIQIQGDDGAHFQGLVVDESFRGMNRVQQQRAVMAVVKPKIDSGELHALALTTKAPD
ncbi:MAG: BolA/IbaG family iron-sulfur metabolism protein [Pseudomonadota bacterium]